MQTKGHPYSGIVPFLLHWYWSGFSFEKRYELVKIFFFPCQKKKRGAGGKISDPGISKVRTQYHTKRGGGVSAEARVLSLKSPRLRSTDSAKEREHCSPDGPELRPRRRRCAPRGGKAQRPGPAANTQGPSNHSLDRGAPGALGLRPSKCRRLLRGLPRALSRVYSPKGSRGQNLSGTSARWQSSGGGNLAADPEVRPLLSQGAPRNTRCRTQNSRDRRDWDSRKWFSGSSMVASLSWPGSTRWTADNMQSDDVSLVALPPGFYEVCLARFRRLRSHLLSWPISVGWLRKRGFQSPDFRAWGPHVSTRTLRG